jgi:hypothetical protein
MEIDTNDEMTARIVAAGEVVSRSVDELKRAVEQMADSLTTATLDHVRADDELVIRI